MEIDGLNLTISDRTNPTRKRKQPIQFNVGHWSASRVYSLITHILICELMGFEKAGLCNHYSDMKNHLFGGSTKRWEMIYNDSTPEANFDIAIEMCNYKTEELWRIKVSRNRIYY